MVGDVAMYMVVWAFGHCVNAEAKASLDLKFIRGESGKNWSRR